MKKRIASLLAALALCLTLLPMAAFAEDAAPDAWDGTADTSWYVGHESDTEYHITTAEQLAGLAEVINTENAPVSFEGKTVYLDNDLDLAGHEWISIGNGMLKQNASQKDPDWYYSFNGIFDGQGHTVYNLYSHDSVFEANEERDAFKSGLFGKVFRGKVMNLGVADANIWIDPDDGSTLGKGILVDYLVSSAVENCWTSGSITGGSLVEKYIGGLVGCVTFVNRNSSDGCTISGCYSTATITGNYGSSTNIYPPAEQLNQYDSLGGIIGGTLNRRVSISDCWFDGKIVVNSIQAAVGGIIGYTDDANIENCTVLTTDIGADTTSDNNTFWIGYLDGYKSSCNAQNNYWPAAENSYAPSRLVTDGEATADSQGSAVSDFASSDILNSLQQNAANGVKWVAGISHPTFAWDSRNILADYTAVDNAVAAAQKKDASLYANYDAVQAALDAVDRTKSKAQQAEVADMAKAIEDAIAALTYKPADYKAVDAAIAKAGALNRDDYTDFSAVDAAINAVDRSKNITQQADVDAMAKAIETALAALVVKPTATPAPTEAPTPAPAAPAATAQPTAAPTATPAPVVTATPQPPVTIPQTGDSMNVTLLFALALCSGAALGLAAHKKNRS